MIEHWRAVAGVLPVVGFYLQPAVGGRLLPYSFWRRFCEIENVVAIKMAPFNRYQTLDVIRAVAVRPAGDIALYTGNDDNILADLLTPFAVGGTTLRIVGGLLGHWAVWTHRAAELLCRRDSGGRRDEILALNVQLTDANAAFFDAANRLPRLHRGHSRGPPTPRPARRHLVPGSSTKASRRARRKKSTAFTPPIRTLQMTTS